MDHKIPNLMLTTEHHKAAFQASSKHHSNDNHHHHHHHHQFAFINGVRVLGSLIVLVSHIVTIFPLYGRVKVGESPIFGYPDVLQNITGKQLIGQPFFNGGLFVQTFFTVSGMLLSYSALLPNSRTISFFPYIWLRAARYLPPLIGTVCLTLAAELYFTSESSRGSRFLQQQQLLRPFSEKCLGGGWWRNLLFISNFSNLNDQCAPHTWYLSAEMQLHIFAFTLLLAYRKFGSKMTYLISGLFCTVGTVVIFSIIALRFSPVILQQIHLYSQYEFQDSFFNLLYLQPYSYFVAYFSGAILGQLLLEAEWTSVATKFNNEKTFESSFPHFNSCPQPSWALARFLSAPIFQPLSRLSFSVYLVHYVVIPYSVVRSGTVLHLEHAGEFEKLLYLVIVYSLLLAYLFHAVFEVPSANLLKLIFKSSQTEKLKTKNNVMKNE
ncbi:hypothetical protein TYRP_021191 [Tyrophagus putrescentiae]|nr:hypothetical protein TYRP_021191 [Tyrophagus putrescentiae]